MSNLKDSILELLHSIGLHGYDLVLFGLTFLLLIQVLPDIRSNEKLEIKDKIFDIWLVILFLIFLFVVINEHFFK